MKTFVVLEQGCEVDYPLSAKHKEQFSTSFSDCFRLNWKGDKSDRHADFFKTGITWAEGRSYLYEQCKGEYDYYVFIDDDIDILSNTDVDAADQLRESLEKYKPIHGSIPNSAWPKLIGHYEGEALAMRAGDLCVQIFSDQFADLMYPAWWSGSGRSMWHAQFLAHRLAPERSLFLNYLQAQNCRNDPHQDQGLDQFSAGREISDAFAEALRFQGDKENFKAWRSATAKNRRGLNEYDQPNESVFAVTREDISSVVDLGKIFGATSVTS